MVTCSRKQVRIAVCSVRIDPALYDAHFRRLVNLLALADTPHNERIGLPLNEATPERHASRQLDSDRVAAPSLLIYSVLEKPTHVATDEDAGAKHQGEWGVVGHDVFRTVIQCERLFLLSCVLYERLARSAQPRRSRAARATDCVGCLVTRLTVNFTMLRLKLCGRPITT